MLAVTWSFAAAQPAENAASTNTAAERVERILDVARSRDSDSVFLTEGGEVQGTILNTAFQVHTAYGSFPIETRFVAGIAFKTPVQHLDSILTVNRNRLSGFINDEVVVEAPAGTRTNLHKHQVRRLVFRLRDSEKVNPRTHQFVSLNNGDLLSGRFTLPEILLTSPAGARSVDTAEVEMVRFQKGPPAVDVQLMNGSEELGQLKQQALTIHLDCGPEITLSRGHLKALYVRPGFVPIEVRQAFGVVRSEIGPPPDIPEPRGLAWISPGKFLLGSPSDERGRGPDEDPQTEVTIPRGFWMGQHEVTQGEYLAVMGANPSHFQGDTNRPVEKVSWQDASEYCARLTEQARQRGLLLPGYVYRLPTEAEWEYACRAGTMTRFSYGDDANETGLTEFGWFLGNSDMSTHPVGRLKPNPWRLYDMHGNVWEWCLDIWGGSYPGGSVVDYAGPADGWLRVARGGSWLYMPSFSRSANRDNYGPENRCSDIGFRVVLAPVR